MNGDEEVKFIKKDLLVAKRQLVGPAAKLVDLIAYTITGNIKQIQKLIPEASPLEQDAHALHLLILNTRGIAVKAYDQARDNTVIPTREWNPVHFALYFQQYKLLKMLVEDLSGAAPGGLGADLKAAIGFSHTENEFKEDKSFDEMVGTNSSESHLYGFMLTIVTKNMAIFQYLYEEAGLHLYENDIFKLLKLCLNARWPLGFLKIVNSPVTARIFSYGSLDFKEEFIRYTLIECESLVSTTKAPTQTDEDVIREVKDRLAEAPYSCLSWLYFDPFMKELKN